MTRENMLSIIQADADKLASYDIHYDKDHADKVKRIVIDVDVQAADIIETIAHLMSNDYSWIKQHRAIFKDGNDKIDKSVACQAIIPILSCGKYCPGCYAANCCVGAHGKAVTLAWYRWYFIEKHYPELYFAQVKYEIEHSKKLNYRLHVSGDFIDIIDFDNWNDSIKLYPAKHFYTYSKVPETRTAGKANNLNIVDSCPMNHINYGDKEYIDKLADTIEKKTGSRPWICKCGTDTEKSFNAPHKAAKDGIRYCGGICKHCQTDPYVLFEKHN